LLLRLSSVLLGGMADRYIDANEVVGYGAFAAAQLKTLLLPMDAVFQGPIELFSQRLAAQSEQMSKLLGESGALEKVTYKGVSGTEEDHLAHARDVLRRLVGYAGSIKGADSFPGKLLGGKSLTTVMRMRGGKLVGALRAALAVFDALGKGLAEYPARRAELVEALEDLDLLDKSVRESRTHRREFTPEIRALREQFLTTYTAAKHLTRSVLTLYNRMDLLEDIFDDLADVHRVSGVKDDDPPTPEPAA
jgi:hypothetical protein